MIHVHDHNRTNGFTLIEMLMALSFLAFILMFSITTIIQVMSTYNKGLAVKEINQAGRATVEDMARYVRNVSASSVNVTALASNRVCFGGISYAWNKWDTPAGSRNTYLDNSPVTFVRISDQGAAMCNNSSGSYPKIDPAYATELLSARIWVMSVTVAKSTDGKLVDLAMQLAVADEPGDPALTGGVCQGSKTGQFCATSSFNTTVTTRGGQ